MNTSKKITFCAIVSALGVICLFLGSVTQVLDLTAVAVVSFFCIVTKLELGGFYPYLVWLVTSALSLLLLPDKFAPLIYALFGGIYPILKSYIEKLPSVISWVAKIITFNILFTAIILLCLYVFHIPDTSLGFNILVYAVCNGAFILFDVACTKLLTLYIFRFRKRLRLDKFFNKKGL